MTASLRALHFITAAAGFAAITKKLSKWICLWHAKQMILTIKRAEKVLLQGYGKNIN